MAKKKGGKRGAPGGKTGPKAPQKKGAAPATEERSAPAPTEESSPPAASVDVLPHAGEAAEEEGGADEGATPGPKFAGTVATSPPSTVAEPPRRPPAAWGGPLAKIERWWTWFEIRLLVSVVLGLVFSMVFWVVLQGMSSPVESESDAGVVLRGLIGAIAVGVAVWFVSAPLTAALAKGDGGASRRRFVRTLAAIAGGIVGALLAPSWRGAGVEYFGDVQNWLQEGSTFTMFGQLRGVSTRLTVVLAFIGGSLAAAGGKHINIDVMLRFVKDRWKLPIFVAQNVATIAFCFVAAWAFFEYVAITSFGARQEAPPREKIAVVDDRVSQDLFLMRKQIRFDLSAAPHVIGGGKWDDPERFTGRKWNEFLETSGYRDYFTPEQIESLKSPPEYESESRLMLAVGPEGPPRNIMIRTMNLTFTAGFIFMGLRFLLRMLLVLSGHKSMEADADYDPDADPKRHRERENTAADLIHEERKESA